VGSARTPDRFARSVYDVARGRGNTSLRILDLGVITAAWLLAYVAGYDGAVPLGTRGLIPYLVIPVATQLLFNHLVGLYGPVWRYASVEEALRVVGAVAGGLLVSVFELAWYADLRGTRLPLLSAPPIAALLMLLGCGGLRFQARLFALERERNSKNRLRTLIIGAGDSGAGLARELTQRRSTDSMPVGFVDDDRQLFRRSVRGLPVFGPIDDLEEVCRDERIDRIMIALPDASRERLRDVVTQSLRTDAQVKVLSDASGPHGEPLVNNLRNLDPADLLRREPALIDSEGIAAYLHGATVLVTGAGGSIGSEISRQVASYEPRRLLLLDRDESLLFEAMSTMPAGEPLLVDIRDEARLHEVFERHRPDVVFHAAAFKHVPILETHAAEAVETNLLATWTLAQISAKYGCRFVYISTDKAAAPHSVLGATKRAAEQVVLAVGRENALAFSALRFGNVLGSRGSVVPTFFRQILEGGPVTVTDPRMTRYFMTIPEAVRLVLQTGAIAEERKVFLLNMGEPVRIVELARQMIRMSGLRPDRDIEIKFVGMRPGEKLCEQLYDDTETIAPTWHPSILGVTSHVVAENDFFGALELMRDRCAGAENSDVLELLDELLRECGVTCNLAGQGRTHSDDDDRDLGSEPPHVTDLTETSTDRKRIVLPTRPALLGGTPAFAAGLPFARPTRPSLGRVMRRLRSSYEAGILTNGPLVAELEERAAERLAVRHVVAVSSCTSGLMLAVQALTEGRSGPVVLPSFTFSATAHAVMWNARLPRFADCIRETMQIDAVHAAALLDGASALIATHVFGAPCDPSGIVRLARAHDVPVLFDAAHAFGARAGVDAVGGFGAAEVFSMTPTKVLVAGEGGLVATNDAALAEVLRMGRNYGDPGDYDTKFAGLNARMSEFHAATALQSLELLDDALHRRNAIAQLYRGNLHDVPGVGFQHVPQADFSSYKDFVITIDPRAFGVTRDVLVLALAAEGIDTRSYFDPPVHRQRAYRHVTHDDLSDTEDVSSRILALPMFTDLRDEEVERVADVIAAVHEHADAIVASGHAYAD
jgi:FlaA1/EpsC-like NDP-sugar epimerase/dTDP-4-amino-4,6-dideoxygalactose transaminase